MSVAIRFKSIPTFRDLAGKFAKADRQLLEIRRDVLRGEGRGLVRMAQENTREKIGEPSVIEKGIKFNTRVSGKSVSLNILAPATAKPHRIAARHAKALAFFWPRVGMQTFVPKRGGFRTHVRGGNVLMIGKGYVDHPGGSLVPLMTPIMRRTMNDWQSSRGRVVLNKISTRFTAVLEA